MLEQFFFPSEPSLRKYKQPQFIAHVTWYEACPGKDLETINISFKIPYKTLAIYAFQQPEIDFSHWLILNYI